ncbi:hypothetical protein PUND_a2408 [Pseudoalteromonas undina]|nr:hypothetical protein PUND_a2408 [Pseudoalteromonas undina]
MFEKRQSIPKHIQKWFVFAFFWLMFSGVLIVISAVIT